MFESVLPMVTGALVASLVPLVVWIRRLRHDVSRAEAARAGLQADLEKAATDRTYFESRTRDLALDRARLEEERDRFRDIAATRTLPEPVNLPEPVRVLAPEWRDRSYTNHPEVNLERIAVDLEPFAEEQLLLTIRLEPQGGWARKLRNPLPRTYLGTVERILEDLRCWLMDDDLRLVERRSEGVVWADPDSPLHFHLDLDRVTDERPQVHVHAVEVAVVETRIVERFVEQPVVIEVPTVPGSGPAQVQVGLSREEVLALFEVELESKLAELGLDPETGPVRAAPLPERRDAAAKAQSRRQKA